MRPTERLVVLAFGVLCFASFMPRAEAQGVGQLLSPGPLSAAHAKLEGLDNCNKCHEPGQGVSAQKCLSCHQPIAQRMAAKKGVHRDVTDDCVTCHVEHAGRDADIRPLDVNDFDHLEETGFALDGRHQKVAQDCAKCHKTRSYLQLSPDCASCHEDVHKGTLGATCITCHATSAPFRETGLAFDH
ncbi:MAG: cytochrome c3 family protein, partial [Acidobacteriota bacterium]